jgi:hypothetical protein
VLRYLFQSFADFVLVLSNLTPKHRNLVIHLSLVRVLVCLVTCELVPQGFILLLFEGEFVVDIFQGLFLGFNGAVLFDDLRTKSFDGTV